MRYLFLSGFFLFFFVSAGAEEITVPLPVVEAPQADLKASRRDSVLFLISNFAPELTETVAESQSELQLKASNLPAEALTALQNSFEPGGAFNYVAFRSAIGPNYLKHRKHQHDHFEMPGELSELKALTQFETWKSEVISLSRVKGKTRVIYRSPSDSKLEMRIAVTLDTVNGDLGAPVRETEILFRRARDSKNWDFFAYSATGQLSTHSHFRNGPMPSPGICMSCHYSPQDRAYIPILQ